MSDQPTEEEVRASIVPKSDQLNADDLLTGPLTVTISAVKRGDREQPIIVEIEGHRPYKPCKSMRRILISAFSDDPKNWVGKRATLFCDPDVTWAGVKVGGIRISHLSGMSEPKTFMLTKTRGKKAEVIIYPLETLTPQDKKYVDDATQEIAEAESEAVLEAIGFILKKKNPAIQDAVRSLYKKRQSELRKGENDDN